MANKLPLEGIRIADFGWILAAPHLTAWLGTLGAEVIKVEWPLHPDTLRMSIFPPGQPIDLNRASGFNGLNYSKKSCSINLHHPEGRELAHRLIAISDIAVEAFGTPITEAFGLDYQTLRAVKPDIIHLSCSPFGRTGPVKNAVAWGPNTSCYAGLASVTGYPDGIPTLPGGTWPDYMCGVSMVFVLLSALHHREKTGEGQWIDLAMGEVVTSMIPQTILDYTMNGRVRSMAGNRHEFATPHNTYRCRDELDWVAISVTTEEEWRAFCQAACHPEWRQDERFADAASRWQNQEELDRLISEWTNGKDPLEITKLLQGVGVAAAPVYNTEQLINDPQMQHRGFLVEIDHPLTGPKLVAGIPGQWSSIPQLRYFHAPQLSQDNDYVFGDLLGLSPGEIDRLTEAKTIM